MVHALKGSYDLIECGCGVVLPALDDIARILELRAIEQLQEQADNVFTVGIQYVGMTCELNLYLLGRLVGCLDA